MSYKLDLQLSEKQTEIYATGWKNMQPMAIIFVMTNFQIRKDKMHDIKILSEQLSRKLKHSITEYSDLNRESSNLYEASV